jgi:hypothetical protein
LKRFTEPDGFFTTFLSTVQPLKTDQVFDLSAECPAQSLAEQQQQIVSIHARLISRAMRSVISLV